MITLKNFEKYTPPKILERGKDYYDAGAVEELEEEETGVWRAVVSGTEHYDVSVVVTGIAVTESSCNCPYGDGSMCKHIVAVLYAIRQEPKTEKELKTKQKKQSKLDFDELLEKIELDELREFIRFYKKEKKDFGDRFLVYFANKNPKINVKATYQAMVKQMVKRNSSRGFMDYRQTFAFCKEVQSVLQAGQNALDQKNYLEAFAIGQVLIEQILKVYEACDDSSGNIGDVFDGGFSLIDGVAHAPTASPELLGAIYDYIEKTVQEPKWFDYGDGGYDLLAIAENIAPRVAPERFLALLDRLMQIHTDRYTDYLRDHLVAMKIHFLESIGKTQEAEKTAWENIEINDVREIMVQKFISQSHYTQAKKLIADGMRIAVEKQHPGTVLDWEKKLLEIARLENDIAAIRQWTKKFAFDTRFNADYYQQWKSAYTPEEWPGVIEQHIQDIIAKEKERPRKSWDTLSYSLFFRLSSIYIMEQQWENLLRLIPESPREDILSQVHPYLAGRYPKEMLAFYLSVLEKMADEAGNRGQYNELAQLMIKIKKDIEGSRDMMNVMAQSLIDKYPRRPAMREELGRVMKK